MCSDRLHVIEKHIEWLDPTLHFVLNHPLMCDDLEGLGMSAVTVELGSTQDIWDT